MKRVAILGVLLICLLLRPEEACAAISVTYSSGTSDSLVAPERQSYEPGEWRGEVAQTYGFPNLPVEYHRFEVMSGRFDSLVIVKTQPFSLESTSSVSWSPPLSTFAGDAHRPPEFYALRLSELMSLDADENRPRAIDNIVTVGDKRVLTVALSPIERDSLSYSLTGYGNIHFEFYGDSSLQLAPLNDSRALVTIAEDADRKSEAKRSSLSAAASGAEYLIITGEGLVDKLRPLLLWKSIKGLTTGIVTMEEIVVHTSGVDDAERLRNYLVDSYNAGTRYVLLAGDETIVPIRYAYHANTEASPPVELMQICDLYYGDTDGNWDADSDRVYGEPTHDYPDLYAELLVGRLPLSDPADVGSYVSKLIAYEQNPGGGDYSYLNRSLFMSADQMRDYQGVGQHQLLAEAFPSTVVSDFVDLVEAPSGIADNPPNPTAPSAISRMAEGWGIITLLVHGVADGWVIRSNQYNSWPKSYVFTYQGVDGTHGFFPNVAANQMPGLVYSIGCNNGAFDMDPSPANPCVAAAFLAKPEGGAVSFVGYSRWGWVATSWRLEKAFLEYLYNTNGNPAAALRYSKLEYSYYRDLCYGLNLYGDPEMRIWTTTPDSITLTLPDVVPPGISTIEVNAASVGMPLGGCRVTLTENDSVIAQSLTGEDGKAEVTVDFNAGADFRVFAYADGFAAVKKALAPQVILDVDDDPTLPNVFELHQNYPNPFNPTTTISFVLDRRAKTSLEVYNVLGQGVKTIVDDYLDAGIHDVVWDGTDQDGTGLASGVYLGRLKTGDRSAVIKMMLLK